MMTRNVPYCDLIKHDESSPYYSAPADASSETSVEGLSQRNINITGV